MGGSRIVDSSRYAVEFYKRTFAILLIGIAVFHLP